VLPIMLQKSMKQEENIGFVPKKKQSPLVGEKQKTVRNTKQNKPMEEKVKT